MDKFNQWKLFQDIDRRVLLVVGSGILLSLFFFTLALAKRPGAQSNQTDSPSLQFSKNLGFTVLKGSPGSNSKAPISAPVSSDQNCTNTFLYWLEKPADWPTDNLVVGQFTYRKETILAIFQAEAQDEVTQVQQQFLAAALNILQGSDTSSVEAVMAESSAWLNEHPAKIDLTEPEKAHGVELANRLADFNRGLTGPGACPGNPSEPLHTALLTPIILPPSPALGHATSPLSTDGESDQDMQKTRPRRESQPEAGAPSSPSAEPPPTVVPTSPPTAELVPTPQVASSEPVVSSPALSPEQPQPAYNPPSQQPAAPEKESKKPKEKEKKNPKHTPEEQPPAPAAPSQPADQPPLQQQGGSEGSPGSGDPENPGNGNGNVQGNGNGGGNGGGNGNGNGGGNGGGNGNGNGGGNGKGNGKKP